MLQQSISKHMGTILQYNYNRNEFNSRFVTSDPYLLICRCIIWTRMPIG